jgi:glycosyltransferase involved in cell wall biosynthesis
MSKASETLVILSPGFPLSESDSTCLPLIQAFVRSIKKIPHDLNIIVLSFQYPYHDQEYYWHGIKVIPFSGRNRGGLNRLFRERKIIHTLNEINKSDRIIGLLSFWCAECAFVSKKFSVKNHLKHFCWLLGQDARPGNPFIKRIKPRSLELIAISDSLQKEFEKNYGIRPDHVIPAGVGVADFSEEERNNNRDIDVIGAGSLIPLKQYSLFVETIAEIKNKLPGIKAVLCGKGPEDKKLQDQIKELGLQNNLKLTGELPYKEVLKLMQRSKVFLHPSSYEGFSGVCLEALHAGAHVISFCQAMNQPIDQWHIVTKNDIGAKTIELLQDPDAKFRSVTPYTSNESAQSIMRLFARENG